MTEEGMMPFTIREASEEDLMDLARLQMAYMQYHKELDAYFSFKRDTSELWMEWVRKLLEDKNQIMYCAVSGDGIVGYISGHLARRSPVYVTEEVGQIGDVFVLPDHRGQGIFTALLEKVVGWVSQKGMKYIEHAVASGNELGRDVWKKKGFEDFMILIRKEL